MTYLASQLALLVVGIAIAVKNWVEPPPAAGGGGGTAGSSFFILGF